MEIIAERLSKKFGHRIIFKNLSFQVSSGNCLAIVGANGSGKTTLMRILAHLIQPTTGKVIFSKEQTRIPSEKIFEQIGFVGPYLELYQGKNIFIRDETAAEIYFRHAGRTGRFICG